MTTPWYVLKDRLEAQARAWDRGFAAARIKTEFSSNPYTAEIARQEAAIADRPNDKYGQLKDSTEITAERYDLTTEPGRARNARIRERAQALHKAECTVGNHGSGVHTREQWRSWGSRAVHIIEQEDSP